MNIGGFQKMTLLDYPEHIACTVFTHGCNLRCPFCHNASLVIRPGEQHTPDEILSYLRRRVGILDGICISGGEPLLQPDLFDFLRKIKELGLQIKLDTNGCYPDCLAEALQEQLLDYVAMDIKNSRERYGETVGIRNFNTADVERSVTLLMYSKIDYEFRTTIIRELHTAEDMRRIGQWIQGAQRYFLQGFIDSGDLIGTNLSAHDADTMHLLADAVRPYVPSVALRGIG